MALFGNLKWNNIPFSLTIQEGAEFNNGNAASLFYSCYGYNNEFVIPNNTISANYMFSSCNHFNKNVVFCDGIQDTSYMFYYCTNFNSMPNLPDYISNMSSMFQGCTSFNRPIHIPDHVSSVSLFGSCSNLNANVTFDSNIENLYATFTSCSNFNRNITLPHSLKTAANVFEHCSNLNQNIQIPSGVFNMDGTFRSCGNLDQAIHIPSGVQHMNGTFGGCGNLTHYITLPEGLIDASGTFDGCSRYDFNVQIPGTVVNAGSMLSGTPIDYNIQIPSSVVSAGGMFYHCRNLNQNIKIPDSVVSASRMFANCENLNQNIQVPYGARSVSSIFADCHNLYIPQVTFGPTADDIDNVCARTKIRNVRLHNENFSDMNYVFKAVERNYLLDLSGIRPITYDADLQVTDWGDPLFTITVPYNAKFYWWTTRQRTYLRTSFYNNHVAQIFGAEMSYYNWGLVQPQTYEQYVSNEWFQEHAAASIFPAGFNEYNNYGVCLYYDWQNTYYNSSLEQNVTPRYACYMIFV